MVSNTRMLLLIFLPIFSFEANVNVDVVVDVDESTQLVQSPLVSMHQVGAQKSAPLPSVRCDLSLGFDPPPGKVVYIAGSAPSTAATATDASGAVYAFNQPPGVVDVTATWEGHTVRPYRLKVARGAVTAAQAMPRPFE